MSKSSGGSFWGIGSFAFYGAFVVFVLGLVLYASIQNVELVESRPYEKGLAYQGRIDQINRTVALDSSVIIEPRPATQTMIVRIPGISGDAIVTGEVRLTRPSNERLDRRWKLSLDSTGSQEVSVAGVAGGLWRIEVDWAVDSTSYIYQSKLIFP